MGRLVGKSSSHRPVSGAITEGAIVGIQKWKSVK